MRERVFVLGMESPEAYQTAVWFCGQGARVYGAGYRGSVESNWEDVHNDSLQVFALDSPDRKSVEEIRDRIERQEGMLDYLIVQTGAHGGDRPAGGLDYDELLAVLEKNVSGSYLFVEALLPLMEKGQKKRMGLITGPDSSIRETAGTGDFAYAMSQASLHIMWKNYFNKLRPQGFTFRCFCPRGGGGISAGRYMKMDFCYDASVPYLHSEENHFIMRDNFLREIPW